MLVGAAALTRQWLSGAGCCRLRCGLGPARLAAPWQPFYEDVVPDEAALPLRQHEEGRDTPQRARGKPHRLAFQCGSGRVTKWLFLCAA